MANRRRRPRKRRPKERRAPLIWTEDQIADLIAWLDLSTENRLGRRRFQKTVTKYLTEKWKADFTWERVHGRLNIIYNKGHRRETGVRDEILDHGTKCLVLEELDDWFENSKVALVGIKRGLQLKENATFKAEFMRQTASRGVSRTVVVGRTARVTRSQSSQAGNPVAERGPTQDGGSQHPVGRIPRDDNTNTTSSSLSSIPPTIADSTSSTPYDIVSSSDTEIDIVNDSKVNALKSTEDRDIGCSPRRRDRAQFLRRSESQPSHRGDTHENQEVVAKYINTLAAAETENKALNLQIEGLHFEKASLVDQCDSARRDLDDHLQYWDRAKHHTNHERLCYEQQLEIKDLREQLVSARQLIKFVQIPDVKCLCVSADHCKQEIEFIDSSIRMVCRRMDFDTDEETTPISIGHLSQASAIVRLLRHMFPADEEVHARDNAITKVLRDVPMHTLLRVIIAGAFEKLVFDTDWPNFDCVPESWCKSRAIEEIITAHDGGPEMWHRLELAGKHRQLSKNVFKKCLLPQKAEDLTQRFLQSISADFNPELQPDVAEILLQWGKTAESTLRTAFSTALKLKADLEASNRYVVWGKIGLGSYFDDSLMNVELCNMLPVNTVSNPSARVKLCLSPSWFLHSAPIQCRGNNDLLLGTHRSSADFFYREQSDLEPLVKASVLLE